MVPELTHGQSFIVSWRARNRAELSTTVQSLAITVDTSPPVIKYLSDFGVGSQALHATREEEGGATASAPAAAELHNPRCSLKAGLK